MKISARDLESLLSVALATIDADGTLRDANAGFRRLLGDAGAESGARVSRFFIQPDFAALLAASPDPDGSTYRGLMTIGDAAGTTRTLRGRCWRAGEGLCVLAEHDIDELEKIGVLMQELGLASIDSERKLGVENQGLKRSEAQWIESSMTDVLTGVGNRRKLDLALGVEIARAERSGTSLSAIMADVDHFKRVNDRFGHTAGDAVLERFGELLRLNIRATDIAARVGGEEFVVLAPGTNLAQANALAERIRRAVAAEPIAPLTEAVTSSFGVVERVPGEAAAALLHRADEALYRAKELGRDRVVAVPGRAPTAPT